MYIIMCIGYIGKGIVYSNKHSLKYLNVKSIAVNCVLGTQLFIIYNYNVNNVTQ